MPELLDRIAKGALRPDVIISHRMSLADAALGYKVFNERPTWPRSPVSTS